MANGAALIDEGLWRRDKDFRALPRFAQCTFLQVLSQKDLDCAGVLTLHIDLLAKGCDELTTDMLWDDFKTLEVGRFIFVDADTDELFVRSYIRRASVRSPNALKSALRSARMVNSPKIRAELAAELRRLDRKDAAEVADEIDPIGTPSETHSEPIQNPSETGNPSEPHPKPPVPVPVPVPSLASGGNSVGERPPPEFCDRHPNGTDRDCGPCGARRRARMAWESARAAAEADERRKAAESAAEARRQAAAYTALEIASCALCDDDGYRNGIVCDHVDRTQTAAAGAAAVRAALTKGKP